MQNWIYADGANEATSAWLRRNRFIVGPQRFDFHYVLCGLKPRDRISFLVFTDVRRKSLVQLKVWRVWLVSSGLVHAHTPVSMWAKKTLWPHLAGANRTEWSTWLTDFQSSGFFKSIASIHFTHTFSLGSFKIFIEIQTVACKSQRLCERRKIWTANKHRYSLLKVNMAGLKCHWSWWCDVTRAIKTTYSSFLDMLLKPPAS